MGSGAEILFARRGGRVPGLPARLPDFELFKPAYAKRVRAYAEEVLEEIRRTGLTEEAVLAREWIAAHYRKLADLYERGRDSGLDPKERRPEKAPEDLQRRLGEHAPRLNALGLLIQTGFMRLLAAER